MGRVGDVAGTPCAVVPFERVGEPCGVAGVGHDDPAGVVEGAHEGEPEAGGAAGDEGGRGSAFVLVMYPVLKFK